MKSRNKQQFAIRRISTEAIRQIRWRETVRENERIKKQNAVLGRENAALLAQCLADELRRENVQKAEEVGNRALLSPCVPSPRGCDTASHRDGESKVHHVE